MSPTQGQADHDIEETSFVRFAQAVLRLATDWAKEQPLPTAFQRRFEFAGTAEWHEPVVAIPNYAYWLQGHLKEITALPETQDCIRTLWRSEIIRYLLPKNERATPTDQLTKEQIDTLAGGVLYALVDLLHRINSFEPAREHILATYARFRTAWTATAFRQVAIIPLLNFRSELAKPLQLSPHYELSPFTNKEKAWVWAVMTSSHEASLIPFHTYLQTEFKLAAEWSETDLNRVDTQEQAIKAYATTDLDMLNDLRNVVTALRLTKPGDVAVTGYVQQSEEAPPSGGYPSLRMLGLGWSDFQVRRHGSVYTLDPADIGAVQSSIEALGLLDSRPGRAGLDVALRRFNQSYSREYYEDRLIALTIALESTLLADVLDPKTDLKYRFVLHGAAVLADRRPQDVHAFLRAMYDARSAVVHSGRTLSEIKKKDLLHLDWREFAQACEDMTRGILAEYVRELRRQPGSTVQSIIKGLETRILEGLGGGLPQADTL
jgi:hypothetical protein